MSIRKLLSTAIVIGTTFMFSYASAQTVERKLTPTTAPGVEVLTTEKAQALIGKAQFYDFRSAVNFGKGHIKGAIALPYSGKSENSENFDATQDRFDLTKLPPDKNALIVMYSDGPYGWKSWKASVLASRAGYKNIKWFREGIEGWSARNLPLNS
jgi:rhodanese-related sulfurtransferase